MGRFSRIKHRVRGVVGSQNEHVGWGQAKRFECLGDKLVPTPEKRGESLNTL